MNPLFKGLFAALVCSGVLTACGTSGGSVPEDRFYRLPAPTIDVSVPQAADVLVVKPVEPLDALRAQTLTRTDRSGIALEHYKHHRWASPPARMVQAHLVANLRASGVANTVIDQPVLSPNLLTLKLRLVRFERAVDGNRRSAAVTLEAELYQSMGQGPLANGQFPAVVEASDINMESTVHAFGQALDQVSVQLVNWIAQAVPPS